MRLSRLISVATLMAALLLVTQACGGKSAEETASEVARDWAASSVSHVASELGILVTDDFLILRDLTAAVIDNQLQEHLTWSYSDPVKVSEGQYSVVATASSDITLNLLLVEKEYRVSADFILLVDTKGERVQSWELDIGSFRATEM